LIHLFFLRRTTVHELLHEGYCRLYTMHLKKVYVYIYHILERFFFRVEVELSEREYHIF